MAKFFLKLGSLDKKLIMILISTILYIIMDIIEYFSEMPNIHIILDEFYARGISYIMLIVVPLIQKWRNKNLNFNKKDRSCKRIAFNLFCIYLLCFFYLLLGIYLSSLKSKDPNDTEDYKMSHYEGLCLEEAIAIFFIIIISKFLLKMKLYIHHFIGLLIFLILSLGIDLLFNLDIFKPNIFFIFIYILYLISDSFYITYEKYMMDKLGYSPYTVVFLIGFLFLIGGIVCTMILFFTGGLFYDGEKYRVESFEDYFDNNDYKEVLLYMIYLISFRFFINILKILTVYYFSPIHTFVSYIIIKMFNLLLNKKAKYKYYSLILFPLQFLGLLIFLEIIELNFWKLNKNTKKNIENRGTKEIVGLYEIQDNGDESDALEGYNTEMVFTNNVEDDNEVY